MDNELLYGLIGIGLIAIVVLFTIFGTKFYYMEVDTLIELLKNTTYRNNKVGLQLFANSSFNGNFTTNNISNIPCTDKKGNHFNLANDPQVEVRLTTKQKKRSTLYFDTLQLDGDYIVGCRSRFIPSLKKKIHTSEIIKVEIHISGKKYKYV